MSSTSIKTKYIFKEIFTPSKVVSWQNRKEVYIEYDGKRYWVLFNEGKKPGGRSFNVTRIFCETRGRDIDQIRREGKEVIKIVKRFWKQHKSRKCRHV